MEERDDSLERKAVRSSWPVRRRRLGEECDDLSAETAAAERSSVVGGERPSIAAFSSVKIAWRCLSLRLF
jgi:hypothetical protein